MNTVHFIRHGENPANITREFSHRVVDYPLTARGVAQAEATARHFADKDIAAIYASPLRRAAQTAEIIGAALRLPVRTIEAFREVNVGALELQPPCEETWALHDRIFADWFSGQVSARFPDGEDHTTLAQRMRLGLLDALADHRDQHIIIVGHGGILAATAGTFCPNVTTDATGTVPFMRNCSITRMRLEARDGDVRGVIETWGQCDHLECCD